MLLLLHSAFILSVVKMLLKGEVGGCAFKSHGNYIVDHGKSWKNHGNVFLNFCGNPWSISCWVACKYLQDPTYTCLNGLSLYFVKANMAIQILYRGSYMSAHLIEDLT